MLCSWTAKISRVHKETLHIDLQNEDVDTTQGVYREGRLNFKSV